jgi:nucleoside-diphosphate-sugar epimerase
MVGRDVPTAPTAVVLAAAAVMHRLALLRGAHNEFTPDGVRYLALRRGTYGIATARELLDWIPQVGLEEGMARTEEWLRGEGLIA